MYETYGSRGGDSVRGQQEGAGVRDYGAGASTGAGAAPRVLLEWGGGIRGGWGSREKRFWGGGGNAAKSQKEERLSPWDVLYTGEMGPGAGNASTPAAGGKWDGKGMKSLSPI